MVVEDGLSLSFWVEAINTNVLHSKLFHHCKASWETAYDMLKGRKPNISYFHVFGCVYYILNQRDQHSNFEANAEEGLFLEYSSVSKVFRVFNLSRKIIEETALVMFDEDSFIHDRIDHPSSILSELTFSPLDPVPKLLQNVTDPVVPDIDQIINSHSDSKDQDVIFEEAEPSNSSNQEDSNVN
ncbi:hypothetical protein Lser_V15G11779 [Lactuca serriola]